MKATYEWHEIWSPKDHEQTVHGIAHRLCNRIVNGDLRGILRSHVDTKDYEALARFNLDYATISVADAISSRQVLALFSKVSPDDPQVLKNLEAEAWSKFLQSEEECKLTNDVFALWKKGKFQFSPRVDAVLHGAQRKISKVLGDVPSYDELDLLFGPGATTTTKKKNASPRYKLGVAPCFSEDARPEVRRVLLTLPHLESVKKFTTGPGSLVFVPKSATSLRSIVIEPSLNTMVQGGLGRYIAKRLRTHAHVDITDQTRNQRMARYGSVTGDLATLDLSSASDSISQELVWHLLPFDWANLLSYWRTGHVLYNRKVYKMEKFSSMGNGFTFPLETLIFWALAAASCEVSNDTGYFATAYGDDIIVPSAVAPLLIEVLSAVGFTTNNEKSFLAGRFRESCGADYLDGFDIRPAYLRARLSFRSLFVLRNFFFKQFDDELVNFLDKLVPERLKLFGPQAYGDGHLHSDDPPMRRKRQNGYSGYTFDTFSLRSPRSYRASIGDYVYPCYSIYAGLTRERAHQYDRKGNLGVVVPGFEGVKRISIYTLG